MEKIKIAIVGYGNIGRFAVDAVESSSDMELVGIVRPTAAADSDQSKIAGVPVVARIDALPQPVDVAILCVPSKHIKNTAIDILSKGIHTVDSFDIHGDSLIDLKRNLQHIGEQHKASAIISAGWDPGSDSVIRALLEVMAPKGITYTNFGAGMSMGHSTVVRSKEGVKNALSLTIPLGTGVHRRMVYVELEEGYSLANVAESIKSDIYFKKDETHVIEVQNVDNLQDMGHGVVIERKGVSGKTHNQNFEYRMKINNPALTAQILCSCARAVVKLQPGAYTMIEVPPILYLQGNAEENIKRLV